MKKVRKLRYVKIVHPDETGCYYKWRINLFRYVPKKDRNIGQLACASISNNKSYETQKDAENCCDRIMKEMEIEKWGTKRG